MPRLRSARRCRASRAWMLWKTTRREEMTASASSAPAAGASSAGRAAGAAPPAGRPAPSCCTSLTSVATCCDRSRASCSSALPRDPPQPYVHRAGAPCSRCRRRQCAPLRCAELAGYLLREQALTPRSDNGTL